MTNVAAWETPLKLTVAPLAKPTPFTVRVKAGSPAVALAGKRPVMPAPTVRFRAAEVPPRGFITLTGNAPSPTISWAKSLAVNCVGLTKVVGRSIPLK